MIDRRRYVIAARKGNLNLWCEYFVLEARTERHVSVHEEVSYVRAKRNKIPEREDGEGICEPSGGSTEEEDRSTL